MGDWARGSSRSQRRRWQQHGDRGGGFHHHGGRGGGGRPPKYPSTPGKPPTTGSRKPTVPSWEKEFCYRVGAMPWRKILEAKSLMPMYKNIAKWDDSACGEAFDNAKARYWAHINELPCDIPQPDPDMYIDEIDWNTEPDPQLVLDLEKNNSVPPLSEEEKKSSFLTSGWEAFFVPQEETQHNSWLHAADKNPLIPTGWGDEEEKENSWCKDGWGERVPEDAYWDKNNSQGKKHPQITSGWGNWELEQNNCCKDDWGERGAEDAYWGKNNRQSETHHQATSGWGDWEKENSWGKNGWGEGIPEDAYWDRNNSQCQWGKSTWKHKDRTWGQWESPKKDAECYHSEPKNYGWKRDGHAAGWYGQRDTNLRYRDGNNYHISSNNSSSYCRGRRRINHAHERALDDGGGVWLARGR